MNLYLVGGAVRDHLRGVNPSGDIDFAVEADSYEAMREGLLARGLKIWQERPEFVSIRGHMPMENVSDFGGALPTIKGFSRDKLFVDADFTLCRAEAMYHDKRHPSAVTPADILTDLSRRDFTMNAIAIAEDGTVIDVYDGKGDLKAQILRTVGNASDRFSEDPLRILRALRFLITYNMEAEYYTNSAMKTHSLLLGIDGLPVERVREELNKALKVSWLSTMYRLMYEYPELADRLTYHSNLSLKFHQEG